MPADLFAQVNLSSPVRVLARSETASGFDARVTSLRVLRFLPHGLPASPPAGPDILDAHPRVVFLVSDEAAVEVACQQRRRPAEVARRAVACRCCRGCRLPAPLLGVEPDRLLAAVGGREPAEVFGDQLQRATQGEWWRPGVQQQQVMVPGSRSAANAAERPARR